MPKRTVNQLKTLTDQIIKTNNNGEITAVKDNALRKNEYDSFLNLIDGGLVVDSETGYSLPITPTNLYAFATVKQVQDSAGAVYAGATPSNTAVGGIPVGFNPTGLTSLQLLEKAMVRYVNPEFTSFGVSGQANTVEVGTTMSGSKTFIWAINAGSGTVPTVDVIDNTTGATLLAGTTNDGAQALTVNTFQLNANGTTQSWKLRGNNTGNGTTFDSNNFDVVGRFIIFFGTTISTPTNSAQVRALPQTSFYLGSGVIQLNTGTGIKFGIAVPPGSSVVSAIDLDASNANVTYTFVGNISVTDAGGTARLYPYYEANIAVAYSSNHRHNISIS